MLFEEARKRLSYLYAALSGATGLLILVWLFTRHAAPVDLATLLAFTLTALIVSYFRVPLSQTRNSLGLDGLVLLGATLAGGPILGGWSAFISGLVASVLPFPKPETGTRWTDRAAATLLSGGCNVIAMAAAWGAYLGSGGRLAPTVLDPAQTLAFAILCVLYALIRHLWRVPSMMLCTRDRRDLRQLLNLEGFLFELAPLPAALLIAATFVKLGWSFYLLMAFVLIGLSAVMRQMIEEIRTQQERATSLAFDNEVKEAVARARAEVGELCALAHQLCAQVVHAPKFELGLYDDTQAAVHIQVAVNGGDKLPAMHLPITPLWEWLGERREPQLLREEIQFKQLPFSLPPIEGQAPQAAILVPLLSQAQGEALGGLVLQAPRSDAFSAQDVARIGAIAAQIGPAIESARQETGAQNLASP
jgi:hypothetical protein